MPEDDTKKGITQKDRFIITMLFMLIKLINVLGVVFTAIMLMVFLYMISPVIWGIIEFIEAIFAFGCADGGGGCSGLRVCDAGVGFFGIFLLPLIIVQRWNIKSIKEGLE